MEIELNHTKTNFNPQRVEGEASGENLAYVIYTSGSTGIPKGMMTTHSTTSGKVNRRALPDLSDKPKLVIRENPEAPEVQQTPAKPALILGIGGPGGDVLRRIRKHFFEKYGPLSQFPILSYLWIDTDAAEKDVDVGEIAAQNSFPPVRELMATMPGTTEATNYLNQHPYIKRLSIRLSPSRRP